MLGEFTSDGENDSDVDEDHSQPVPQGMGTLEKVGVACSILR